MKKPTIEIRCVAVKHNASGGAMYRGQMEIYKNGSVVCSRTHYIRRNNRVRALSDALLLAGDYLAVGC